MPRDDPRIVEGMDEDEAAPGLDLAGAGIGRVVVVAVEDDLGAVTARRRHLRERRPLGHHDDGRDAEPRGVKGYCEAVIAGARGDDPAPPLGVG